MFTNDWDWVQGIELCCLFQLSYPLKVRLIFKLLFIEKIYDILCTSAESELNWILGK